YVGLRQDFQQRDFKWRQRNRSIEAVPTLLPLASHTGMAKQKGCDQIGFVTIGAGIVAVAREVAQQRFGNLRIKVGLHSKSQHGGSDRHVEELNPELHLIEGGAHVVGAADDVRGEFGGRGQLSAELVTQQPLVEALHSGQQREFPLGILNQSQLLRDRAVMFPKSVVPLVKPKGNGSAISYLVTEVTALLPSSQFPVLSSQFPALRTDVDSPAWLEIPCKRLRVGSWEGHGFSHAAQGHKQCGL